MYERANTLKWKVTHKYISKSTLKPIITAETISDTIRTQQMVPNENIIRSMRGKPLLGRIKREDLREQRKTDKMGNKTKKMAEDQSQVLK